MGGHQRELVNPVSAEPEHLVNMKTREADRLIVRQTNSQTASDNPQNSIQRISDNTINLIAGEHAGLIITTTTTISGVAGTKILPSAVRAGGRRTDSLLVDTDNIVVHVSNVHFTGFVRIGIGPSGVIASAPTVIFQNCIFDLTVNCSGKMHLIGCEFRDPVFSTVNFSGAAFNFIVCCSRKNGGVHSGAPTIVGGSETT
jgi:hypothetical protein